MMTTTTPTAVALARDPALSDEEIVRRVREGDTALYEVLMRRHNPRVYRAVRSILRDEAEVEDAMQQAYLSAFAKLEQFTGAARFSTWLVTIAINEAHTRVRGRLRLARVGAEIGDSQDEPRSPETEADMRERVALVERALDALPQTLRSVLMLRVVDGLDTDETAAALGVSGDVVKTRLHRARAAIRDAIERDLEVAAREAFPFHATRCDRVVAGVMNVLLADRS